MHDPRSSQSHGGNHGHRNPLERNLPPESVAQKVARSLAFSMGNAVFFHVLWVFFFSAGKKKTHKKLWFWLGMMTSCWLKGSQNMIVCDFFDDLIYDIDLNPPRESGSQKNATISEPKKKTDNLRSETTSSGGSLKKVSLIYTKPHPPSHDLTSFSTK